MRWLASLAGPVVSRPPTARKVAARCDGRVRYAVVGAGSVARVHLEAIAAAPGVELVGIADPVDAHAWKIAERYRHVAHFRAVDDLLEATRPDLVSVCTPNRFHCDATLRALAAGAHVVCEKPMAMTLSEAQRMDAARARQRVLGAINFSYRNSAVVRYARTLVREHALGRIGRVNVAYLQSYRMDPATGRSWRNDASVAGFGALGDLGAHMIDSVRYVTGLEFRRVTGITRPPVPRRRRTRERRVGTDTSAACVAELDGGVVALLEASQVAPGYGDSLRLEISGDRRTLALDTERPDQLSLSDPGGASTWTTSLAALPVPKDFAGAGLPHSPGAIVRAIRGEAVDYPTFADGIAVQRVLEAIVQAARSHAWVATA